MGSAFHQSKVISCHFNYHPIGDRLLGMGLNWGKIIDSPQIDLREGNKSKY